MCRSSSSTSSKMGRVEDLEVAIAEEREKREAMEREMAELRRMLTDVGDA